MSVQTFAEPARGSNPRLGWAWPMLPATVAMFCLTSLICYHVWWDGAVEASGLWQSLTVGIYRFFGFAPAVVLSLMVLVWSTIWYVSGAIERPLARVLKVLALTLSLAIVTSLRADPSEVVQGGVIGEFLAVRLQSVVGHTVSLVLIVPAVVCSFLLATDFLFHRYFEDATVDGGEEAGVEAEAVAEMQALRLDGAGAAVLERPAPARPQVVGAAGDEEERAEERAEEGAGQVDREEALGDEDEAADGDADGVIEMADDSPYRRRRWRRYAHLVVDSERLRRHPRGDADDEDEASTGAPAGLEREQATETVTVLGRRRAAALDRDVEDVEDTDEPVGIAEVGELEEEETVVLADGDATDSELGEGELVEEELEEDVEDEAEEAEGDDYEDEEYEEEEDEEEDEDVDDEDEVDEEDEEEYEDEEEAEEEGAEDEQDVELSYEEDAEDADEEDADADDEEYEEDEDEEEAEVEDEDEYEEDATEEDASDEDDVDVPQDPRAGAGTPRTVEVPKPEWRVGGQPASRQGTLFEAAGEDAGLLEDATDLVVSARRASVTLLQRRLRLSYVDARDLLDALRARGVVGGERGAPQGEVLVESAS